MKAKTGLTPNYLIATICAVFSKNQLALFSFMYHAHKLQVTTNGCGEILKVTCKLFHHTHKNNHSISEQSLHAKLHKYY